MGSHINLTMPGVRSETKKKKDGDMPDPKTIMPMPKSCGPKKPAEPKIEEQEPK